VLYLTLEWKASLFLVCMLTLAKETYKKADIYLWGRSKRNLLRSW